MTPRQKNQIASLVRAKSEQLGSQRAVAQRVSVSAAIISQILNKNWDLISDELWIRVGAELGYTVSDWKLVPGTYNMRVVEGTFMDAKRYSMFMCVSHKAGGGKTAAAKLFLDKYYQKQVFYIHCREWTVKQFLAELCRTLGISQPHGVTAADDYMKLIIDFFIVRAEKKPLLIIDEADKLKGSAMRQLIPLYNATEDKLGVVLMGTEHLEVIIKRGVQFNQKGFDEIDSRLGRKYIKLFGATKKDVEKICIANGITNKKKQTAIWQECEPKQAHINGQFRNVIEDMRRLKRVIQRELVNEREAAAISN